MQVEYHLAGFDPWGDILWFSGFLGRLNQFSPNELEQFRQDHQAEIGQFATEQGVWLNVEVLISVGRKSHAW